MAIYKNGVIVPTYTDAEAVAAAIAGAKIGDFLEDTLANINAKVSDATLDDSGDTRTPSSTLAHEATHVSGGSDDIDDALADAAIPNLATSKITSTRFPVARLPAMTDEMIWKGTGTDVEEVDMPSGGTKEIRVAVIFSNPEPLAQKGNHPSVRVRQAGGFAAFEFRVPHDFTSIVSAIVTGAYGEADVDGMNVELQSDYGTLGEDYNGGSEAAADVASEQAAVINKLGSWDVSGVLTGIVAGDRVGLQVLHEDASGAFIASDVYILELYIRYA